MYACVCMCTDIKINMKGLKIDSDHIQSRTIFKRTQISFSKASGEELNSETHLLPVILANTGSCTESYFQGTNTSIAERSFS